MSRLSKLLDAVDKTAAHNDDDDIEAFALLWEMFEERDGAIRHLNEFLKLELKEMGVEL